jgi:dipeptidyl aminopeptidase/acylaminoacyl peptidase
MLDTYPRTDNQGALVSKIKWVGVMWLVSLIALFAGLAQAAGVDGGAFANKRSITETDLFQFHWIGDPQISPVGGDIVYVGITVDEKRTDYVTTLYRVSSAGNDARRITSGKRDSSPRWSLDGRYLSFLRSVEKDGKPQPPQLWVMPMQGGEAWQITMLPMGVSQQAWSPDGKTIAFLSAANEQDLTNAACELAKAGEAGGSSKPTTESTSTTAPADAADRCKPRRVSEANVITRVEYRSNGLGYRDFSRPRHIWTVPFAEDATTVVPKQISRGEFDESDIVWAPDGSRIYFTSERDHEPYYKTAARSIYAIPAVGGESSEVGRFAGNMARMSISPKGDKLAFFGVASEPVQSHTRQNLWVMDIGVGKNGSAKNISARYDWEVGGSIIGDQAAPRAGGSTSPLWSADGNSIIAIVAKEGRANVERFDLLSGAITALTKGDQAVTHVTFNGTQLVAKISSALELNELYDISGATPRRLTGVNDKLFAELKLTAPLDVWYKSFDGRNIHTLVQLPPDFDASKKYPLILNIHGGPHAAYGYNFFHEMHWMAARGYIVLYPNPRGSTTYGEAFGNIIQHRYPGDDYLDLMAGVDEMVRRGNVDTKRMGVTGGSGGGLLTNWAVGHTDRFAAAVSQRDISDWTSWWYTADFSLFQPSWFKKPPFEDPADYRARSPITYINKVKTPMMFILGDVDSRTPAESGGDQMFRALKYKKIPTVMVRFPGESHDLSRAGKPWNRIERLQHIVNWFDIYLQGKKANDYDVMPPAKPDLMAK